MDQQIATTILQKLELEVVCASNGQEAIEVIERERPDVVLTDLQMPVMDGLQLVREVKERYPGLPVVLVTGAGSEEIAVEALRSGASSYVPKRNLPRDLERVLQTVFASVASAQEIEKVRNLLQHSESYYILDYEEGAAQALINYLQEGLAQANIGNEADWQRAGMALAEALTNAVDHGNLELDSSLREDDSIDFAAMRKERMADPKYSNRRVHVIARMSRSEATFVIRDEGPGFDPSELPDPTDPENLTKATGRGILLIRTFMEDVRFNDQGNEITMITRNSPA